MTDDEPQGLDALWFSGETIDGLTADQVALQQLFILRGVAPMSGTFTLSFDRGTVTLPWHISADEVQAVLDAEES